MVTPDRDSAHVEPVSEGGEPVTAPVETERVAGPGELEPHGREAEKPEPRGSEPHEPEPGGPQVQKAGIKSGRLSGAWTAVIVAAVVLIFLLIFILQNLDSVTVRFLGMAGTLPLGVGLLFATIGGALLVFLVGTARIVQLRRVARKAQALHRR